MYVSVCPHTFWHLPTPIILSYGDTNRQHGRDILSLWGKALLIISNLEYSQYIKNRFSFNIYIKN